jgi:hypothetical protein
MPDHRRPSHRDILLFPGFVWENRDSIPLPPESASQSPKGEAARKATVATPDFQPHLVTVTPPAAKTNDQVSITIIRPGQPNQIMTVPRATGTISAP